MKLIYQYIGVFFNFLTTNQLIFFQYKSRIARAIRGL